jgi:hypothetical protein
MISDIAAAVAPSYGVMDLDGEELVEQVEFLRRENKRLKNLATKYKANHNEMADAVYSAAYEALSRVEVKQVKPPNLSPSSKGTTSEVCNPFWSDWQLGKRTPSYNTDITIERVERLVDKTIRLTHIQRSEHPVDTAHVYMLGDMVEGEEIFAGQQWTIDSGLYHQVTNCVQLMVDALRRMLSEFETVHVVGVEGNHGRCGGRNSRNYHPDTNFDRMAYKFASMMFQDEPRISFDITEGRGEANYYAVDNIGNYGTLLVHGDDFPSPTALHSYHKKVLGWRNGGIKEPFLDVAMGHYHQNLKMTIGTSTLRINGTTESDNLFAGRVVAAMGRPSQHLQYVHPSRGEVTAEYDIYLD